MIVFFRSLSLLKDIFLGTQFVPDTSQVFSMFRRGWRSEEKCVCFSFLLWVRVSVHVSVQAGHCTIDSVKLEVIDTIKKNIIAYRHGENDPIY